MPLVVEDTLQVTIRGDSGDGPYANVLHVHRSETDGPFTQALAVLDTYVEDVLPVLCQHVVVNDAAYVDLSSEDGSTGTVTPTLPATLHGGVTTEALPPNCAMLVKLGGVSARGVRNGRMYLPGVRQDEVNEQGDISEGQLDTYQTAMSTFVSDVLANAGEPLVIVHNPGGGDPSTTEVLGAQVAKAIATQRRRLKR